MVYGKGHPFEAGVVKPVGCGILRVSELEEGLSLLRACGPAMGCDAVMGCKLETSAIRRRGKCSVHNDRRGWRARTV